MKTIYNVYVPIESQEQSDRMKQICIDYGLPYWDDEDAFTFNEEYGNHFYYSESSIREDRFCVLWGSSKTQVTESEFLELVKINFANSK